MHFHAFSFSGSRNITAFHSCDFDIFFGDFGENHIFRHFGRVGRRSYTTFEAETELDNIRVVLPPHSAVGAKEM